MNSIAIGQMHKRKFDWHHLWHSLAELNANQNLCVVYYTHSLNIKENVPGGGRGRGTQKTCTPKSTMTHYPRQVTQRIPAAQMYFVCTLPMFLLSFLTLFYGTFYLVKCWHQNFSRTHRINCMRFCFFKLAFHESQTAQSREKQHQPTAEWK